ASWLNVCGANPSALLAMQTRVFELSVDAPGLLQAATSPASNKTIAQRLPTPTLPRKGGGKFSLGPTPTDAWGRFSLAPTATHPRRRFGGGLASFAAIAGSTSGHQEAQTFFGRVWRR